MAVLKPGFRPPLFSTNPVEMARQVTEWARSVLIGKVNVTLDVTLVANAASTTVTDARIGYYSAILFSPLSADAAAEIGNGTLYVSSQQSGQAVLTHANNAQTDRNFRLAILG